MKQSSRALTSSEDEDRKPGCQGRVPVAACRGRAVVNDHARRVQDMFQQISPRYDLLNRVMSLGQDQRWRRRLLRWAAPPSGGTLLDVGAGTGRIAEAAAVMCAEVRIVSLDFSLPMLVAGRSRIKDCLWCCGDALRLPFGDETFDAVVCAYLLRNVSDISTALSEQCRVLRPGGRLVCLETTPRPRGVLGPLARFYLQFVVPLLGHLLAGSRKAYVYLRDSSHHFLAPEELARVVRNAGLEDVRWRCLMQGTQVLVSGCKRD